MLRESDIPFPARSTRQVGMLFSTFPWPGVSITASPSLESAPPLRRDKACAGLATTPVIHPHEQEDKAAGSAMSFVVSLQHWCLDPQSLRHDLFRRQGLIEAMRSFREGLMKYNLGSYRKRKSEHTHTNTHREGKFWLALTLPGEFTYPVTATADSFADRTGFLGLPTWPSAPDWDCQDYQPPGLSNFWVLNLSGGRWPLSDC